MSNKTFRDLPEEGDRIIVTRGEHLRDGGVRPIVVATDSEGVLAYEKDYGTFYVKHGDYHIVRDFMRITPLKVRYEKWLEEEKELLYELQEEVADENPGKDAQRYWEAKHAYDKQKLKIETIEAAMQIADGK